MRKLLTILITLSTVIILGACSTNDNPEYNINTLLATNKFLTTTVYNATINKLEDKEVIDESYIKNISNESNFRYDKIKVIKGFSFDTILDFNLKPYFLEETKGKKTEVVISLFALFSEKNDRWYEEKMIIFKTENEIAGFLSTQFGVVDLNSYPVDLSDLYFESFMFLTQYEVIKYYDMDDTIYHFNVDLSDFNNIVLDITRNVSVESQDEKLSNKIITESLTELESSEILDFMKLAMIERIDVDVTVQSVDTESGYIYVSSDEVSTLESIHDVRKFYDSMGNEVSISEIKEGDILKVYYYERYNHYSPVSVKVNEVIIK